MTLNIFIEEGKAVAKGPTVHSEDLKKNITWNVSGFACIMLRLNEVFSIRFKRGFNNVLINIISITVL